MKLALALAISFFASALAIPADAQNDTRPFALQAKASPELTPLGGSVAFFLTVTNTSTEPATFGVNGCPVYFTIDGKFTPQWGCAEFWRQITLQSGESITFGPEQHGGLRVSVHEYPLAPGPHMVSLWVPDIGPDQAAITRFQMGEPKAGAAYLAGRLTRGEGIPALDGTVILHRAAPDSVGPDSTNVPPFETHEVKVGPYGYWFLAGVHPGLFTIQGVLPNGESVFYPGVSDPSRAEHVPVGPGEFRDGLDMAVLPGPPPPPPAPGLLVGAVYEDSFTDGPPVPIWGAMVRAVPVGSDATTDPVPPDVGPPLGYVAASGEDGQFVIEAPPGPYILLAGHPGYRYRYWSQKDTWDEADVALVFPADSEAPQVNHTLFLWPDLLGDPATIRGQILGREALANEPPHPIAGALVRFLALVGGFQRVLLQTQADENGFYAFTASPGTPYFVEASAEGYPSTFYGVDPSLPTAVDVKPGGSVDHVDITLWSRPNPGELGIITGFVFEQDATCDQAAGCWVPAAGATVRVEAAYPTFAPYVRTTVVGRDGSFRVDGLASDHEGTLSYYVSAMRRNSESFYYPGGVPYDQAEPLPVFSGRPVDAGRILMGRKINPGVGVLNGRLVDGSDHGIPHGLVKLFVEPENPSGRVLSVVTNVNGEFSFHALPLDMSGVMAAAADGYVPGYYPHSLFWRGAERVRPPGPNVRMAAIVWTLHRRGEGPYVQAGRVRLAESAVTEDGVDPAAATEPGILALAHHRRNIPHALFYMMDTRTLGPVPTPRAGGFTGDNGSVILTGLPEGAYFALADRPGYEFGEFRGPDGSLTTIILGPTTPAVLADIDLTPPGGIRPPEDTDGGMITGLVNAPNPFSPGTTVRFTLHDPVSVCVQVFDFQGRLVRTLLSREARDPGDYALPWNGTDDAGRTVHAGVYFYRVEAGAQITSRKMVLLPR